MRRRVILSIDGGGIRGLIPIAILKRLNDLMKYQLQSNVDLYAGTSTGSLIGGALMLKTELGYLYNITDILNLYSMRSSHIFKTREESNQNPLKFIMEKTFQNLKVKDQSHDFLFTTEDNSTSDLHLITNRDTNYSEQRLSDILLACSAVKGYFDPVVINGKQLSDGVTVMKNPSLIALDHYQELYPEDQMIILSLGTGDVREFYDDEIERSTEKVHETLSERAENDSRIQYFRIQPKLRRAKPEMNDTSQENIQNLIDDAKYFIGSNNDLLDRIVCKMRQTSIC